MNTRARDFMLASQALSGGPKVAAAMGELIAERDQLRAVVDAVRRLSHLYRIAESADFDDITPVTVAMERVDVLLAQLDVSPVMGEPDSAEGAPHESDGGGPISGRGAPDPPNGGPVPPSTPAPQPFDVGPVEHTRLGHYVSTYCLHGRHGDCRQTCKVCEAPCGCGCHASDE